MDDATADAVLEAAYGGKEQAEHARRQLRNHGAGHPSDGHRPPMIRLLQLLLDRHPGFRVIVTGHSLGAGVAGLVTMLLARHLRFDSESFHRCGPPESIEEGDEDDTAALSPRSTAGRASPERVGRVRFPF